MREAWPAVAFFALAALGPVLVRDPFLLELAALALGRAAGAALPCEHAGLSLDHGNRRAVVEHHFRHRRMLAAARSCPHRRLSIRRSGSG